MSDPTKLFDVRVEVSPETNDGERTVVVRQGRQTDADGPLVLGRDQRATASIAVTAEERSDGASVQVGTDLFLETLASDGGVDGWATLPDDLPGDFDDRDFADGPDSAMAWLSNQPKKKDVRTAALDEAGVSDPYRSVTKSDWARVYLELRRRRLAIDRLDAALEALADDLNGMPGKTDVDRRRSDAMSDVWSLGLDLRGHTNARGKSLDP